MPFTHALVLCTAAAAQDDGTLDKKIQEMESRHEKEMEDVLDRLDELEKSLKEAKKPRATLKLIDISLDGLFAVGGSTATNAQLLDLQGGGHDPHQRGFTVQNVELSASGAVDPYFTGEAHIVYAIDPDGETEVELEEMFLTTTSLPWGLQVKAGQYLTEFGRNNPTHPHTWDFVDQPFVITRMFGGDGMRGPGARISWLAPTPFSLEAIAGVQNAVGETMPSFFGAPGEPQVGGHPRVTQDVGSPADMVYTARAVATVDVASTTVLMPGASGAFGPNGTGGRTSILGGDLTLKWKPLANEAGFPFVTWTSEYVARRFAADAAVDPATSTLVPGDVLHDAGYYTQVVWGFARGWTLGARHERGDGSGGAPGGDPMRDRRTRESLSLTWYPSEFSKIRLEGSRDRDEVIGKPVTSVWLQFEILIGAHGAHKW
jgi:hypothetical protein